LVEKVFQKRSKSSIFAVARTTALLSFVGKVCALHPYAPLPFLALQLSV
jgi:hypothetical protein